MNEVAQLRKEDARKKGTIPFLRVTTSDAKGHEIKTSSSRREVPIHPAVIAEGFLTWNDKLKAGWLFTDLPPEALWATRRCRFEAIWAVGARPGRHHRQARVDPFVATRMEDKLREMECLDEVPDSIRGHARKGQKPTHGDRPPLKVEEKCIGILHLLRA